MKSFAVLSRQHSVQERSQESLNLRQKPEYDQFIWILWVRTTVLPNLKSVVVSGSSLSVEAKVNDPLFVLGAQNE